MIQEPRHEKAILNRDGQPAPAGPRRRGPYTTPIQPILNELIAVLRPHPRGLRRWSVMKAMRDNRKRHSRDIPNKFEDDIERVFHYFCAGSPRMLNIAKEIAPFYRPVETAGEVWAMHPERTEVLLACSGSDSADFTSK